MTEADQIKAIRDKLEAINSSEVVTTEEERVDELLPALAAGAAAFAGLSNLKGYLNKLGAANKAVGSLTPEEVKQLAATMAEVEKLTADKEVADLVAKDPKLKARMDQIAKQGQTVTTQAKTAQASGWDKFKGGVKATLGMS